MKQVVRRGISEIVVDSIPAPSLAPHHVLIRTHHSLISAGTETASIHAGGVLSAVADNPSHLRTVWNAMQASGPERTIDEVRAKFRDYAVLGYAGAGVVEAVHPTVTDLTIGQRVAYGGEGTGHGEFIATGRLLTARVPDGLGTDAAAFATLGSIALHAVRNAALSLGDSVVVLGLGLVGQLIAQLARAQGARVIAVDLDPTRVELARSLGVEHALVGGETLLEAIQAVTNGRGADVTIIAAAAKSSGPAQQAMKVTRERGRVVVVGAVDLSFPYYEMFRKELLLTMSRAYGPGSYDPEYERGGRDYPYPYVRWTENRNMEEFLRLVATGAVQVAPLISHRYPMDDAPAAYASIMDRTVRTLAVVLEYPSAKGESTGQPERRVELTAAPKALAKGTLGVALVGAGNIARWAHLPAIRKADGAQLVAIVSGNGAKGKAIATRFGANYATSQFDDALADPQVNTVVITSRNQSHAGQALRALERGKHVFIEKPMAVTADEADQIVERQRATGLTVGVAFNRRFAPTYVALKRALGRRAGPAVINARMSSPYMTGESWMTDPAAGGAIVGEACHLVDLMGWLLGERIVEVQARALPLEQREPRGDTNIVANLVFTDGSVASLTYHSVGDRRAAGERVELFAPGVSAASADFKHFQRLGSKGTTSWFPAKGYDEQFAAFVQATRGQRTELADAADGAHATKVCLAILASALAGGVGIQVE
jgi:predicted dehydrogenase/threonine dehydrogenase-like Zn-dependent dehydrogenase